MLVTVSHRKSPLPLALCVFHGHGLSYSLHAHYTYITVRCTRLVPIAVAILPAVLYSYSHFLHRHGRSSNSNFHPFSVYVRNPEAPASKLTCTALTSDGNTNGMMGMNCTTQYKTWSLLENKTGQLQLLWAKSFCFNTNYICSLGVHSSY
jgi:hypothetical protein